MYYKETTFLIKQLIKNKLLLFPGSKNQYEELIYESVIQCANILVDTDALYHDLDHTFLVTLCGQDIFIGKKILDGNVSIEDWIHYTIALLFHDIGYVRNILKEDSGSHQVVNIDGDTINVPPNCTDAHLTPYHVERSQLFLRERNWTENIDLDLICDYVKNTEFPVPKHRLIENIDAKTIEMSTLVTSADLIGQLADPSYYRKIPALYYEFEETGANFRLGYSRPADLKKSYPAFFYNYVRPHISKALEYLNTTNDGRSWTSNLNFHVFCEEHRAILSEDGMSLLQKISKKMAKESNFDNALHFILNNICNFQKWPVGHAYCRTEEANEYKMSPTNVWHINERTEAIDNFVAVTSSMDFATGIGLPGRVLKSGKAAWIEDVTIDPNFPRAQLARDIGVKGAFAFPVKDTEGVSYVLEFYSLDVEQPDAPTLSFMSQIGYEISKYL